MTDLDVIRKRLERLGTVRIGAGVQYVASFGEISLVTNTARCAIGTGSTEEMALRDLFAQCAGPALAYHFSNGQAAAIWWDDAGQDWVTSPNAPAGWPVPVVNPDVAGWQAIIDDLAVRMMDSLSHSDRKISYADQPVSDHPGLREQLQRGLDAGHFVEAIEFVPAQAHQGLMGCLPGVADNRDQLRHPMQPVGLDARGTARFKANAICQWVLDQGLTDMNELAVQGFSDADRSHWAQLIGYSVGGYCDLSYTRGRGRAQALRRWKRATDPAYWVHHTSGGGDRVATCGTTTGTHFVYYWSQVTCPDCQKERP